MKTIGLIGGLSWESSAEYYRIINQFVQKKMGGVHSAKIVMHSFDFQEIKELQHQEKWPELTQRMIEAAQNLKNAGADFIVICSNTMHKMADDISTAVNIPLLHIADPTGQNIVDADISKILLLGTDFTMTHGFYKGRLKDKFGLQVLTPDDADRVIVHGTIYNELVKGGINPASRQEFARIIDKAVNEGAEGVILGCTEIMLLVKPEDSRVPIFDTTTLHAENAASLSLTP